MKGYVIYLPEYESSCAMSKQALNSGKLHNWDLDLYAGVDGQKLNWDNTKLKINQISAKCSAMMTKPGVQGCFMSHWQLWNLCADSDTTIGIFEHDIEFIGPIPNVEFEHLLKLEGFSLKKPRPAGEWYEGARAYILKPAGARLLINWVNKNGALPADVNIGLDVLNITLDTSNCIQQHELHGKINKREQSFTWNLKGMK